MVFRGEEEYPVLIYLLGFLGFLAVLFGVLYASEREARIHYHTVLTEGEAAEIADRATYGNESVRRLMLEKGALATSVETYRERIRLPGASETNGDG